MKIRVLALLTVGVAAVATGCGGKGKAGSTTDGVTSSNQQNIPKVDPALCDTSGKQVQTFDLNQDNRPDVWKLYAEVEEDGTKLEVLTCKQVDYDHDGKKDYVATYSQTGELVAEEFDFTFDGTFDAREHYDKKGGKIYMVERDVDHNKAADTWEKYDTNGDLESVERDRNGDGKPDYWEQYARGELVAILYDEDFDQKVDRKQSARSLSTQQPGSSAAPPAPAPGSSTATEETAAPPEPPPPPPREGPADETPTAPAGDDGKSAPATQPTEPAPKPKK